MRSVKKSPRLFYLVTTYNYYRSKAFSDSNKNPLAMQFGNEKLDEFLDGGIICGYVMVMVIIFRLAFKI